MFAIEITDISKTFTRTRGKAIDAVKNLSLNIKRGEVFGFLGPNGAGKSTTIKMLMGLIRPSAGKASILGVDTLSPLSRINVGYLPENPSFYDYLSAEEYLRFVGKTFAMEPSVLQQRTEELLRSLQLWDARSRPIRSYSKGMVQRLGLAQTLLHDPEVYILDEPMSGLDPVGRALVKDIILDLRTRGKCVFFSTHITSDVETVCNRIGIIVNGRIGLVDEVGSILEEGIIGYRIQVRLPENGGSLEVDVPKADLHAFMTETNRSGREITLIEPRRKNLEAFFLDIVSRKQ